MVFKAQSVNVPNAKSKLYVSIPLAHASAKLTDGSVMVKSAPPPTPQELTPKTPGQRSPAMERMALIREYEIYGGSCPVKTNQFIRKLHVLLDIGKWLRSGVVLALTNLRRTRHVWYSNRWIMFCGTRAQSHTVRNRSFPRLLPGRS